MYKNTLYEKRKLGDRVRELSILALFTIIIAFISMIVMDILIYPLSFFAVNNRDIFNFIIQDLSVFVVALVVIFLLVRKFLLLRKDGLSWKETALYFIKSPLYYCALFLVLLVLTAIIVAFIYIILGMNNDILLKLTTN